MNLGLGLGLGRGGGNAARRIIRPFFNGMDLTGYTYTGGPVAVADADGALQVPNVDVPSIEGGRFVDAATGFVDTDTEGAALYDYTLVRGQKLYTDADPTEFPRIALWGASTNYFLNSQTPVTQNITTTAQQYTVSVVGGGRVTLSGTATGVATGGSPLTVTATAGTLTCTVADTLTHVQVEVGAYAYPPIYTGATTVTRPATRLVGQSAGVLRGNNLALMGTVIPGASGQTGGTAMLGLSAGDYTGITTTTNTFRLYKGIETCLLTFTHQKDVPLQYQAYLSSSYGMGIRVRSWLGMAWSAWSAWATNANTDDAPIASTFELGSRNNNNRFVGNYPEFRAFWKSDPKAYLEGLDI